MNVTNVEIDEESTRGYLDRLQAVIPRELPPGVDIFDEQAARQGLRLNKAGYSLRDGSQRALFAEDYERWLDQFGLSNQEKNLLRTLDWTGMWRHGMSIYIMVKLAAVTNTGLPVIGKHMKEAR